MSRLKRLTWGASREEIEECAQLLAGAVDDVRNMQFYRHACRALGEGGGLKRVRTALWVIRRVNPDRADHGLWFESAYESFGEAIGRDEVLRSTRQSVLLREHGYPMTEPYSRAL